MGLDEEPEQTGVSFRRLLAAHAHAARRGLTGEGLDPVRGEHVPALVSAERLLERAAPGLAATGDLNLASERDLISGR
ncbi:hypothetical protein [Streptomyces sp. NPDC059918]|uniref:hypothetical protein n=1 Tax=unclassified Streptomyces TaxID=2593676 RepID=UPI00364CE0E7